MSKPGSDYDLEKFRQEWKKELQHCSSANSSNTNNSNNITEYSKVHVDLDLVCSSSVQENIGSKSHPSNTTTDTIKLSGPNQNDNVQHNLGTSELSHFVNDYLPAVRKEYAHFDDDNSQDVDDTKAVKALANVTDEAGEYYPFKILTKFLNEAPKRLKVRDKKSDIKSAGLSYSKRKYFVHDLQHKNDNKKLKVDNAQELKPQNDDKKAEKKFLDLFIADLDEITEIPFFDINLPRELALQIFQHLDLKSLCSCSQVSRSWRSLAEDELLWCRICHNLGFDTELQIVDGENWKGKARWHTEQKRIQKANWKARIGKPYHLSFPRGGVLCAVHSHSSIIVAGYTSCNVRSWNIETGDECTLNASNTALVLDENAEELGRIHNEIKHVSTTKLITAASFKHGFVDIWSNDAGTEPVHTCRFNNPDITSLSTHDLSHKCSVVAASQATRVQVACMQGLHAENIQDFDMSTPISQVDWYKDSCQDNCALLVITCHSSVHLKKIAMDSNLAKTSPEQNSFTEIHNIIWAPVSSIGLRESLSELAVGFNVHTPSTQVKVNIYDTNTSHLKSTLTGHTWFISCIHMPDCLPHELVTGSGDRKIRLYDTRVGSYAAQTLVGHIARVKTVQMDDWKVVSADEAGFVNVWDQRMCRKLWDIHNRHPVEYCHFDDRLLIIGNVPYLKFPQQDEFETVSSLRYRGTVQVYDFLANQQTQGIPDICLSTYTEPEAYDYNIGLAVPYDTVN
ncbi:F-box/WD repeat-containing protein 8-like [Physella acuta]|uniref:F-box/WD repeat-containing protein 8-like n=1 Tax=Physella acuta TaxID=109671 RepID=UPI0027DE3345|nr:F-box/WD repeat-containing protein 8-like [Physella acuta]